MPGARTAIAKRYAEAVFETAKAHNSFDRWLADLATIASTLQDTRVARLIASPTVRMSAKERILAECLDGIDPQAWNLVRLLLRKGRFALAPQIAEHYRRLLNDHRGIATAEVTSAVPLEADELDAIARRLSAVTGRRIVVETAVDPSIIGGIVARIGDQLIDASVRGRLLALKKRLAAT